MEANREQAEACRDLGSAALTSGDYPRAIKMLQKCHALFPQLPGVDGLLIEAKRREVQSNERRWTYYEQPRATAETTGHTNPAYDDTAVTSPSRPAPKMSPQEMFTNVWSTMNRPGFIQSRPSVRNSDNDSGGTCLGSCKQLLVACVLIVVWSSSQVLIALVGDLFRLSWSSSSQRGSASSSSSYQRYSPRGNQYFSLTRSDPFLHYTVTKMSSVKKIPYYVTDQMWHSFTDNAHLRAQVEHLVQRDYQAYLQRECDGQIKSWTRERQRPGRRQQIAADEEQSSRRQRSAPNVSKRDLIECQDFAAFFPNEFHRFTSIDPVEFLNYF